ncbi:MAG: hybrid sensor histidine kinase/response regulator [Microcystaceae cyanobacterium]
MSSTPETFADNDNWFDNEIEGLLQDLKDEDQGEVSDGGLEDLNSLFEENSSERGTNGLGGHPQRLNLSFEDADSELEALFENESELEEAELDPYETSSWLELESTPSKSFKPHNPTMGAEQTFVDQTEWRDFGTQTSADQTSVDQVRWDNFGQQEQEVKPSPKQTTGWENFDELDNLFNEVEQQLADSFISEVEENPQQAEPVSAFLPSELDELREMLGVSAVTEDRTSGFSLVSIPTFEPELATVAKLPPPVKDDDFSLDFSLDDFPVADFSLDFGLDDAPVALIFYEEPAQWDSWLEVAPQFGRSQSLERVDVAALEALIEAPFHTSSVVEFAQALPVAEVAPPPMVMPSFITSSEPEDDFKDLEALLEQADRTMGGPPTMVAVGGQRFQPRNRTVKTKVFEQTMRVPVKQLDNLSNLIGELVVKRNSLEQDQERLRQFLDNLLNQTQNLSDVGGRMQDLYERTLLEGALLAGRSSGRQVSSKSTYTGEKTTYTGLNPMGDQPLDALEMDRFTGFHLLSQEMIELIVRVRESASDIQYLVDETDQVARTLRQVTTQLQEGMTKSRMVPFAQTADRLPRAIREVSMKLNKQVNLEVEGREVLIDKMILEHLYNPMTHLVNNAITHGIETPEERRRKGKPSEGQISVSSFLQGNQTLITVSDDGAGIDSVRVKQKAIEKGLISSMEANSMTDPDVYDLLFHAGFSTKDQADDFSGRGVGLDVVRTSLLEIRGSVVIDSTPDKGTTFSIRLPLTLSICKALGCISDRARIAFPIDGIEDTKEYLASDLILDGEQTFVQWNEQRLQLYRLNDLLSYHRQLSRGSVYGAKIEDENIPVIILRGGASTLLAVRVDQITGEEEIVIKQIEGPIPKPPGIAGATVRGDGSIMPIGDVIELIDIAQGRIRADMGGGLWRSGSSTRVVEQQLEPTVLIVDDSITVRELLSLSFSKSGYRVEQARDGQEAWEKLRSGLPCDLVFCDIEMPRMNGLELLSQLQSDDQLSQIPIALLTSRGADRHRKVAAKLGASGYYTKPYTEKDILDAAARMIQGEVLLAGSTKQSQSVLSRFKKAKQSQSGQMPLPQQTVVPAEPRVLIIDDSVMVREMLSLTYRKAGYIAEMARDGQDAWEKLRSGLPCDLILCDIEMPRMNGLELLERLQKDPQLAKIPIAMITSRGAQKMQRLAAEKGAKGYFVKPYIEEALLEASQRLIAGEVLLDVNALAED